MTGGVACTGKGTQKPYSFFPYPQSQHLPLEQPQTLREPALVDLKLNPCSGDEERAMGNGMAKCEIAAVGSIEWDPGSPRLNLHHCD